MLGGVGVEVVVDFSVTPKAGADCAESFESTTARDGVGSTGVEHSCVPWKAFGMAAVVVVDFCCDKAPVLELVLLCSAKAAGIFTELTDDCVKEASVAGFGFGCCFIADPLGVDDVAYGFIGVAEDDAAALFCFTGIKAALGVEGFVGVEDAVDAAMEGIGRGPGDAASLVLARKASEGVIWTKNERKTVQAEYHSRTH